MTTESTQSDDDSYILPRDEAELRRLNDQNDYAMTHIYGNKYVCVESFHLSQESQVLDSGTGTGAWLIGLARTVSGTVQIFGTDISSNNFPDILPANVHMSVASSTSLPPEWTNKFDFVNQRFLQTALRRDQWTAALVEIFRVLKPGGAVQIVEGITPESKGPAMAEADRLVKELLDGIGLYSEIAVNVDKLLESVGFVDVCVETRRLPVGRKFGASGEQGTRVLKPVYTKVASTLFSLGLIESELGYMQLLDEMEAEWDEHGVEFPARLVIARKPLE